MAKSPVAIIFGTNAQELTLTSSAVFTTASLGVPVMGIDPNNRAKFIKVDAFGSTVVTGTIGTVVVTGATAIQANLSASITSIILLSASLARTQAIIYNDSPSELFVAFAAVSSYVGGFTYNVVPYFTLELPQPVYNGVISGIWSQQTGSARVTELRF